LLHAILPGLPALSLPWDQAATAGLHGVPDVFKLNRDHAGRHTQPSPERFDSDITKANQCNGCAGNPESIW
jgi:hypothetical protein